MSEAEMGNNWRRHWTLDELAIKHGTDKSEGHGYTKVLYPQFLDQIRYLPVSFLEIGVLKGASLKMWDEYFTHPDKQMFAWDIVPEYARKVPKGWRFHDVDSIDALQVRRASKKLPMLDVVIDDGCHELEAVLTNFNFLWKKMNTGGLYIVEDQKYKRQIKLVPEFMRLKARSELHVYGEVVIMRKL